MQAAKQGWDDRRLVRIPRGEDTQTCCRFSTGTCTMRARTSTAAGMQVKPSQCL